MATIRGLSSVPSPAAPRRRGEPVVVARVEPGACPSTRRCEDCVVAALAGPCAAGLDPAPAQAPFVLAESEQHALELLQRGGLLEGLRDSYVPPPSPA